MKRIQLLDCTLREGLSAPDFALSLKNKCLLAKALDLIGVDVLEIGTPAVSNAAFESVRVLASKITHSKISILSRCTIKDTSLSLEAIKGFENCRLHLFRSAFLPTFADGAKQKPEAALEQVFLTVRHAKGYIDDIQFSVKDATSSDPGYVLQLFDAAISAGATTVNLVDSCGNMTPFDMVQLVRRFSKDISPRSLFSVHCHDTLGLSTANSLAAVIAGVDQVECTLSGIGPECGNTALEELYASIKMRPDILPFTSRLTSHALTAASELLRELSGHKSSPYQTTKKKPIASIGF